METCFLFVLSNFMLVENSHVLYTLLWHLFMNSINKHLSLPGSMLGTEAM